MKKVIIIAVVLLIVGGAAYFLFFNKKEEEEEEVNETLSPVNNESSSRSVTAQIATLPYAQKKLNQDLISNILASKS